MSDKETYSQTVYGLKLNPRPGSLPSYLILCAVLSAISIVISWLAVVTVPGGFLGIGAVYFASIFYALCTYWFGVWGLIASFIGAFVGSGLLTGMPAVFALPFAVADIIEPLLPFLLLRTLGKRIGIHPLGINILSKPLYLILFIIFGAILPPFISGLWGTWILTKAGFVPPGAFIAALVSWWVGAAILLAIFVPPICRLLAGFLQKTGLACHGIFS